VCQGANRAGTSRQLAPIPFQESTGWLHLSIMQAEDLREYLEEKEYLYRRN
jgi:DNA-dependent RNA polymerase auxiliary subunit epsilon